AIFRAAQSCPASCSSIALSPAPRNGSRARYASAPCSKRSSPGRSYRNRPRRPSFLFEATSSSSRSFAKRCALHKACSSLGPRRTRNQASETAVDRASRGRDDVRPQAHSLVCAVLRPQGGPHRALPDHALFPHTQRTGAPRLESVFESRARASSAPLGGRETCLFVRDGDSGSRVLSIRQARALQRAH